MTNSFIGDFFYIERALFDCRARFAALEQDMTAFEPKSKAEVAGQFEEELARVAKLNPHKDAAEIAKWADERIEFAASYRVQFANAFSGRMTEAVTVTLLSHALCEALIDAIIGLGLALNESTDLFPIIERASVKEKWLVGPRLFARGYTFPKDGALYESLHALCKRRDALAHSKLEVRIVNQTVLESSGGPRQSFDEQSRWVRRFLCLPYDLRDHAVAQIGVGTASNLVETMLRLDRP